mgnify:CR=1 FL=1
MYRRFAPLLPSLTLAALCLWTLAGALPRAAQAATSPPASPQSVLDALSRAHAAVVGVEAQAIRGARSADTLGLRRSGSGVVIAADGLVLTIGYLILEADSVELVTQDGRRVPARVAGYDLATGFGLVQPLVPLRNITPVPLGSLGAARVGEVLVTAVGGEDSDVSMTRLVSQRPFSGYWEYHIESALFTSPPVQAGGGNHSGAALFNQRGELLGIGSLFVPDTSGLAASTGRRLPGNMFVPVDLLKPVLAEMRASGTTTLSRRPWLGLSSAESEGRLQIVRIAADSPAQAAGLRPGDTVLAIDGEPVSTLEAFYKRLWSRPDPEGTVELRVRQGEREQTLQIKAIDRMRTLLRPSGV